MPAIITTTDETLAAHDREIGTRIREARKAKGLTQTQLGEALGVSFQQVQKYERGCNRVSSSSLIEIAKFLGVKPSALLDDLAEEGVDVASPAMELTRQFLLQPYGRAIVKAVMKLSSRDEALVATFAGRLADATTALEVAQETAASVRMVAPQQAA